MPSRSNPQQGEIWLADLNPPVGHEQAGPPRPVLVISGTTMNRAPYSLSLVVPLTTRLRNLPGHIFLAANESGLRADSEILCEHLRSISHGRFKSNSAIAKVTQDILLEVKRQVLMLMEP